MNPVFGTATVIEIVWTLCAVPGLLVWISNFSSARRDVAAVRRSGVIDGRFLWAKFSVLLTAVFSAIEAAFVCIGATAMLHPSANNGHLTATGWVFTVAMIGSSAMIAFVGLRWRIVSRYILNASRHRLLEHDKPVE